MATATYSAITRADMAGFDAKCIDLAMEAQELGWTGKMSSKGHMIMRAPDGETTFSISRRWTNGRAGMNMRSNLERWKRQALTQPDFTAFDQITEGLEREQFVERLKVALVQAAGELDAVVSDAMSAVYSVVLQRDEVAAFAFQCAKEQRISHFGWLAAYPDDPSDMRAWTVNWAVFDRRDGRVIDFGGPRHTEQGDEWTREYVEVQVAERLAWERGQAQPDPVPTVMPAVEVDEARPHVCEVCGRTFKLPMNLGRHMSTVHKPDLKFEGDPMEDGLDDLMGEGVSVQMDDHLTIVVDPHDADGNRITPAEPVESNQVGLSSDALAVSAAMEQAIDGLGLVAQRMALLESERLAYEQRLTDVRREYEDVVEHLQRQVDDLTRERDNARESVSALKSLVADL